ncbi:MAG: serine hydrolase domain-containing protein [Planctomycetota bacterium]
MQISFLSLLIRWRSCAAACGVALVGHAATAQDIDYSGVTAPIGDYLAANPGLPGAALLIVGPDGVLHERYWGDYRHDTQVPIASATKWLSGIAVMSLVDDGLIDLDAPVSQYLPDEFPPGHAASGITVRQMFSHTSGLPGQSIYLNPAWPSLERSVELIATNVGPIAVPGVEFNYGGVSMHIAGRIAEVVTGQEWDTLFAERVATPLGLTDTDYEGLGTTDNPRIAGGARSTIEDYQRVLAMLRNGGTYDGRAVLSPEAVQTILADQTAGAVFADGPPSIDEYLGYGIGNWIEVVHETTDESLEFSSPGGFGTTPWINPGLGVYGVFMIDDELRSVDDLIDDVRELTRDALQLSRLDGDFDADGVVGQTDLNLVLLNWGSGVLPEGWIAPTPLNDGTIGQDELNAVLLNWGKTAQFETGARTSAP